MKLRLIIFHTAIALAVIGLLIGGLQMRHFNTILRLNGPEMSFVFNKQEKIYRMPFTMQLQKLQIDRYASGNPKNVTATLSCVHNEELSDLQVSINHPVYYRHYQLYIQKYWLSDTENSGGVQILLVRQPAQELVYAALILLIFILLYDTIRVCRKAVHKKTGIIILVAVILVSGIIMCLNPMMRNVEVPPILRSAWFIPHLIAYILAYALLLTGFVLSILLCFRPRHQWKILGLRCFQAGIFLFAIGLILGMLWAKTSWGAFWGWDPKETFALLTLLIDVGYLHYFSFRPITPKINMIWQTLGFLSLQMCWYGVQLFGLGGLHVY